MFLRIKYKYTSKNHFVEIFKIKTIIQLFDSINCEKFGEAP